MRFPLTSSSARPGSQDKVEENGEGEQIPVKKIWSVFESQAMLAGCTAGSVLGELQGPVEASGSLHRNDRLLEGVYYFW